MSTIAVLVPSLILKNLIILGNTLAVCLVLPFKKETIVNAKLKTTNIAK